MLVVGTRDNYQVIDFWQKRGSDFSRITKSFEVQFDEIIAVFFHKNILLQICYLRGCGIKTHKTVKKSNLDQLFTQNF